FYLDDPRGRDIVAHWKERPGMLGLRFYTNDRHPQSWFTDGTLDWLWPAAERAGVPVSLGAAMFLPTVGQIAERHPGLKLIVDHMGVPRAARARWLIAFSPNAGPRQTPECGGEGDRPSRLCGGRIPVPQPAPASAPLL